MIHGGLPVLVMFTLLGLPTMGGLEGTAEATAKESTPTPKAKYPFIQAVKDQIKETEEPRSEEGFSARRKKILEEEEGPEAKKSFIQSLKDSDKEFFEEKGSGGSFTEEEKKSLEKKSVGGAIAKLKAGQSELEFKKKGRVKGAVGVMFSAYTSRSVDAGSFQNGGYSEVYGNSGSYIPNLSLFYEWQPFHSEWFASVGLYFSAGISYDEARGEFADENGILTGLGFSSASPTFFNFIGFPGQAGVSVRLNSMRLIRPYIVAQGGMMGIIESRTDSLPAKRGYTFCASGKGGVAIMLDWFSSSSSWNLYNDFGIHHLYLLTEVEYFQTFGGLVNIQQLGAYAGLSVEF